MNKKLIAITALVLACVPATANAKTYHIYSTPKASRITSVGQYGYTYHRMSTVKCPFAGCRRLFSHK